MNKSHQSEQFSFAVTGNPILHSKSPTMFNAVFRHYPQLFPVRYSYGRIAADSAAEAVYLFNQLGLTGMNVTAPFKQEIIPFLDLVDPHASRIGSVNTVVRQDNGLIGYNTDFIGVVETLVRRNIPIEKQRYIILGAGGAGRAAAYGLVRAGAEVIIANRTYEHAAEAAKLSCCRAECLEALPHLLASAHVLISTLASHIDIVDETWLKKELVVFDANYKNSLLVAKALRRGCRVLPGEDWLLNQAIPAFEYFTGILPPADIIETMRDVLFIRPWEKPNKIALIGFMASGKSTIGKSLAKKMGYLFKDLDSLLEKQEAQTIPEIFKTKGESYFRQKESQLLKKELNAFPPAGKGIIYACGGGAVLSEENKVQLIRNALVVWLYATPAKTMSRLTPGTRPLLETENPEQEVSRLLQQRLPLYGRTAHIIVNSENEATAVAGKIHEEINKTFNL